MTTTSQPNPSTPTEVAAREEPQLFGEEIRAAFRSLR
jgi:hypothetical protein